MAADSARVLPLRPSDDVPTPDKEPFVETSLSRALRVRMEAIHRQQEIGVFAGPWGIGKTRAIHTFAEEQGRGVVIVNVEPGAKDKGRTPVATMQLIAEALLRKQGRLSYGWTPPSTYSVLRSWIADAVQYEIEGGGHRRPRLTIIFDEAQHLSRTAIEMLRFWNDRGYDRQDAVMRVPIGLIFVGNQEFALEEDLRGHSVLTEAVRSRARFIGSFGYADLTRDDIERIVSSRGIADPAAVAEIADHFGRPRVRRDLRQIGRIVEDCRLRAEGAAVTAEIARKVLFGR